MHGRERSIGNWKLDAIGVVLLIALLCLILRLLGVGLFDGENEVVAVLVVAVGAGVAAWYFWRQDLARGDVARAEAERAREEAERANEAAQSAQREAADTLRRFEDEQKAREQDRQKGADELHAEQEQLERERKRTQQERRNAIRLRREVVKLHTDFGGMAPTDDIRSLVLRVALKLLDARKGMLLSRVDDDGDGKLDVVAVEGFERDVKDSRYAQRFAGEVVANDRIVREDAPEQEVSEESGTADQEIETLVAIPIYIADQFSGVIVGANREGGFEACDDEVLLALGDQAGAVLQNTQLHGELRSSYIATVRLLADAIQAKDPFLRGHSEEVAEYVSAVARSLDIEPRLREQLNFASLLHDVGKIGISERILLKPGGLTPEERSIIELHPRIGFRLVEQVPGMGAIAPAILHHHEWFDGSGYPARLRGEEIPLEARIISVADSFSAMTEQRPYRERMSLDDACTELQRCAGTQFDPTVVKAFVEAVNCGPQHQEPTLIGSALNDAELVARRASGEPILGAATAALTDSLTLLYSHRYFHETAQSEADRAALQQIPFTIVMVELQGLDEVNRSAGYAAGDSALREAARALSRVAIRYGALACRTGGSRLALIVTGLDAAGAERLGTEVDEEVGRDVAARVSHATWQSGDAGHDVVTRARTGTAA